jgi:hypothetical protein
MFGLALISTCMLVTSTILLHTMERRHDNRAKLQEANSRFHFEFDAVVIL